MCECSKKSVKLTSGKKRIDPKIKAIIERTMFPPLANDMIKSAAAAEKVKVPKKRRLRARKL